MHPNPLLKRLGLQENDRAVIFHADDIGMCHASVSAYKHLVDRGLLSSAAAMVPCPWFAAVVTFCRGRPDRTVDMGVHLTLTSEWEGMRWGPVSTADPGSGLIDAEGYFFRDPKDLQAGATEETVARELTAQIERALAAGIDVTHIDAHMFAIFHARFLPLYFELSRRYRVPAFLIRADVARLRQEGYEAAEAASLAQIIQRAEDDGLPLLDHVEMMSLGDPGDRIAEARRRLARLPAGISYFIIHPAMDTPELRAMAPDWPARVADYELFCSETWRRHVAQSGVHVIGWRPVRDLMRESAS